MCEKNMKSKKPEKCKKCGSIRMYFDPSVGPIVGGFAPSGKIPNAHHTGSWICMDCVRDSIQRNIKLKEEKRKSDAPKLIKEKRARIQRLEKEIKELEKL